MNSLKRTLRELARYPSAVFGLSIIGILVLVGILTPIFIPYQRAIELWRGGEEIWYANPKNAPPAWINWFRSKKLVETFTIDSAKGEAEKVVDTAANQIIITYAFDYQYDTFPQEIILYFRSSYKEQKPFASIMWYTPDGRQIPIDNLALSASTTVRFSQNERLNRRFIDTSPIKGLFIDPNSDPKNPTIVKGDYKLILTITVFEPDTNVDTELVVHGQVSGWAGTDHRRRDLGIAILWGTPIALLFGLLAALGTSVLTMVISAIGTWYGGWVDELIQRITGVNLVIPFLPILIMVGTFYSRSIWVILSVTIALSIFGSGIVTYRSVFLQVKESPYIEAARSYGASNARIILMYMVPRVIPLLIPGLVTSIPGYVFLEASLAVLGLGDPVLPTWGKIINDAQANGALYQGLYYWVLEPAALLMITGLAFAMLGFSLDRIFNPRLRGQ